MRYPERLQPERPLTISEQNRFVSAVHALIPDAAEQSVYQYREATYTLNGMTIELVDMVSRNADNEAEWQETSAIVSSTDHDNEHNLTLTKTCTYSVYGKTNESFFGELQRAPLLPQTTYAAESMTTEQRIVAMSHNLVEGLKLEQKLGMNVFTSQRLKDVLALLGDASLQRIG